jgi:hypothetical protein
LDNDNALTIDEPPVLPTWIRYNLGFIGGHDDDVIVLFTSVVAVVVAPTIVGLSCCW